jgi:hypothetical protein
VAGASDAVALALGHDGLWVFANRICADRRRRRRGRLLARQVGGGSSAQHGQDPNGLNTAMNPAVLSTARNAVVTTIMIFITLVPLLSKPSDERPRDAPIRPHR